MGIVAILVMCPGPFIYVNFGSPFQRKLHTKNNFEKIFENCEQTTDWLRTDDRRV